MKTLIKFYVTGTFHDAHVLALSEGDARRIFHHYYNGESIIHLHTNKKTYQSCYPRQDNYLKYRS